MRRLGDSVISSAKRGVVLFARHGRSEPQSFLRKRESIPQNFGNSLSVGWIHAFAGMTGVW
jgi:hypothetical protein